MDNLRINTVQVVDSTNIEATFTHTLTPNLSTSNVSIVPDSSDIPEPEVLKIEVNDKTIKIICQPMTPYAAYYLTFASTNQYLFKSKNGEAVLLQDNVSNKYLITGPLPEDNVFREYLISYLKDNLYNVEDNTTVVNKYIQSLATNFTKALYDIGQVKNDNYLSKNIIDERKVRGKGPTDRLDEEGAYYLYRVGKTPTGTNVSMSISFDNFPSYPVTVQRELATQTLTIDSVDTIGIFNINSFILNMQNSPITKVTSVVFTQTTPNPIYTYDLEVYGYQLKSSRYDQDYASTYLILEDNQIRLNSDVLGDPDLDIEKVTRIDVSYQYKDRGRVINDSSLNVYTTISSTRETVPSIINVFTLEHAPVVSSDNTIPTTGGVTFIDPNNSIPNAKHPAFLTELPFRLSALPSSSGQYSVDYETGTVYVYGEDSDKDGTGPYPPLATYLYRHTYQSEIDYTYDADLLDIVALPEGSLVDYDGTVSFSYEKVLVPDVDYKAYLHFEELTERVDNRLVALNVAKTENTPITNVFRVYNETSGEIYPVIRWNDNKIYFRYINAPRIIEKTRERASFKDVVNEMMFVNAYLSNTDGYRIFKILLDNNTIIGASEDGIGSSVNSSVSFSKTDIFVNEKWYDRTQTAATNIDLLSEIGQYMVDYVNGIIYCAVSSTQNNLIGYVTYKNNNISPENPHIISVEDIYYRIGNLNNKSTTFTYLSFDDGEIIPSTFDYSDELLLNDTSSSPYQVFNSRIGAYVSGSFVSGVSHTVKSIRGIYERTDLKNSTNPLNFARSSTSSGKNITVSAITGQSYESILSDGSNLYVNVEENVPYISPYITYTFSVIRTTDSKELWNSSGTIIPGETIKLILPGINSPVEGEPVEIIYSFEINNLVTVAVDYDKGGYYIDYTYLADEIILSYEYGDNSIDFREGNLASGTEYYVTYKAGALRDALYRNFGNLVDVPELTNFDIDFDRERYRDALSAALASFIQGPTVNAIKNIGKTISHITPDLQESVFQGWSLGNSLLNPQEVSTTGSFQQIPCKFGDGVLMDTDGQSISLPVTSNIKLSEGTFETWIEPQWNGLDNEAELTFTITRNGSAITKDKVFIGAGEIHPDIETNNTFTVTKATQVLGTPNKNKDGIFIYNDLDSTGSYYKWYVEVRDGYVASPTSATYRISIESNGSFYNAVSMVYPKPSYVTIFSGVKKLRLNITGGSYGIDDGVSFVSDIKHYILDLGESEAKNRLSLFKDVSGYLNFRTVDKNGEIYTVSSNVSEWKAHEKHHVAISWKLNTINARDEMHLFIDGFEVPNILHYGQKLAPYLNEKFRTIDPERIVGLADRDILSGTDLQTTLNSNLVISATNFSSYNIFAGDTIFIDENGFDTNGYTINTVLGQSLLLDSVMPSTLTGVSFSVNRTEFTVDSEINVSPNIAVSTIHSVVEGTDISGTINTNVVTSASIDFSTQDVSSGYLIRIVDGYLPTVYSILQVSTNSLVIDGYLPVEVSNESFFIYSTTENEIPGVRALRPTYSISKSTDGYYNDVLTISNDVFADDLILIKTLGLSSRRVSRQYYMWSDNTEYIIKTRMPPPVSLDEANIYRIILPSTVIGPNNSTIVSGKFVSNNITGYQPSNSQEGRTVGVTLSGTNTDFTTPVEVTINGQVGAYTVSETLYFTDYGTQYFTDLYIGVNYVNVIVKPTNIAKNALAISLKEKYPMTHSENSGLVPVIRYSYQIGVGYNLYSDGYTVADGYSVTDGYSLFSDLDVGNYLLIHSPIEAAGFYLITKVSTDKTKLYIQNTSVGPYPPVLPTFTNGVYQILQTSDYRSGLQNGYFTLEAINMPTVGYVLPYGFYELDYYTYLSVKMDVPYSHVYFGSDFNKSNQANCVLDQIKVYSKMLTDTRIGETVSGTERTITRDYNSLKALEKDSNTLVLLSFDDFPFTNAADFYINSYSDQQQFHSSNKVNDNFTDSLAIFKDPMVLSNDGIIDGTKEGSIEFWTSPLYDTGNDPNDRYYFDAYSAVEETVISETSTSVKISSLASSVISVTLKDSSQKIDYFAGGKLELDTQRAIRETQTSISNSAVMVDYPVLQVITVKIVGDSTGTDYFTTGKIGTDKKTIYLGKTLPASGLNLVVTYQSTSNNNSTLNTQVIRLNMALPSQNSNVVVRYLPSGIQGDRISLFNDVFGYVNFRITASGTDYIVRAPTKWIGSTWHRIKATYKINGGLGLDEMRLYLDGYQYNLDSSVLFGSGLIYGEYPGVMGGLKVGDGYGIIGDVVFKDPINTVYIGSEYTREKPLFGLINNMRISNISRPVYSPYNEPLDVAYNSNSNVVYPVTKDLYTTYLQDSDVTVVKNEDFATIVNRETGIFSFLINIFDSLDIISDNIKVKNALEKLIKVLKPANSKVYITYTS